MNKLGLIFFLIVALGACKTMQKSSSSTPETEELKPLKADSYQLELTEIKNGNEVLDMEGKNILLIIDLEKNTYSGKSGCNSYFGKIEMTQGNSYKFNVGGVTEMLCGQEVMQREARYLNALVNHEFKISEKGKSVFFKGDDSSLTFTLKDE